jgi:methylenetetrahydrofolate--tRNA-(uracil-5-)-methyltransferase
LLNGKELITLPRTTILGSLCHYVTHASLADFQPMKANFGLLPPLELESGKKMRKRVRAKAYAERAIIDLETYLSGI